MTLHDLAIKHGSDKADHKYCPFYEQHLPKNPKKILEIGVFKGASIRMWKEWFPETVVHGLDLFQENPMPEIPDIIWHKGNQCDWQLLEQLRKEDFDVIIDDGSHNSRDQLMTFFGLFNGKQYYIEDIHCADFEFYRVGLPLGVTAKKIFDEEDFRYKAIYAHSSPIVLIQST
jgi:hypothetical protein